jgi:hypothetical protein
MKPSETTPCRRPRLLVLRTAIEAWRLVYRERRDLSRAAALPLAISTLMAFVFTTREHGSADRGTELMIAAISSIPLVGLKIGVYRHVLYGTQLSWRDFFGWSQVHTLFVGWTLVRNVRFGSGDRFSILGLFTSLALLASWYALARASFVLPAAVSGEPPLLSMAWIRSRNNGGRLVLLEVVAALPLFVLMLPLFSPSFHAPRVTSVGIQLFSCLIDVACTAAHALAFRAILELRGEEVPPSSDPRFAEAGSASQQHGQH